MHSKAVLFSLTLLLANNIAAHPINDISPRGNAPGSGNTLEDDEPVTQDPNALSPQQLANLRAFEQQAVLKTADDQAALSQFKAEHPGGRENARYAPLVTPNQHVCPNAPQLFRRGNWDLPEAEKSWLKVRKAKVEGHYRNLISDIFGNDKDAQKIVDQHGAPVISLTVSGGGYRSMLHGAGVIQAWQQDGKLQNLADSSTYLVGVSGGAWLVASLAVNKWMSVAKSLAIAKGKGAGSGLWDISERAWAYRDVILNKAERILWLPLKSKVGNQLRELVNEKGLVPGNPDHFKLSSTDYWGRRLAMQMFYDTHGDGMPGYTWSNIADQQVFKNGDMPMPIVTSAEFGEIDDTTGLISLQLPVYEYTPFEWGTQYRVPDAQGKINPDGSISGAWWMSTKYMGTRLDVEQEVGKSQQSPMYGNCVTGYDDAGFIMGASSSFFNAMELRVWDALKAAKLGGKSIIDMLPHIARFIQSFAGFLDDTTGKVDHRPQAGAAPIPDPRSPRDDLLMVDGGMTGENLASEPILRSDRNVQIAFMIDSSNDKDSDPEKLVHSHGTALLATANKNAALRKLGINVPGFPLLPPDQKSMTSEVNRIRFFGCDEPDKPLLVYVPNHDWPGIKNGLKKVSSVETTVLELDEKKRDLVIKHGYELGKGAGEPDMFEKCVGCALLWRSTSGQDTKLPKGCGECYEHYCYWGGGSLKSNAWERRN